MPRQVLESAVQDLGDHESNPHYVEDLFDDVENLSESDPDIDTISVHSTPKPRLRSLTIIIIIIVLFNRQSDIPLNVYNYRING